LLCASAAVADIASTAATMPVAALFTEASLFTRHIACGFEIFGAIMPHGVSSGKANSKVDSAVFSAKRNDRQDDTARDTYSLTATVTSCRAGPLIHA
jgi:hypothetical protein